MKRKNIGSARIGTQGFWVGSKNASFVLWSPTPVPHQSIMTLSGENKWINLELLIQLNVWGGLLAKKIYSSNFFLSTFNLFLSRVFAQGLENVPNTFFQLATNIKYFEAWEMNIWRLIFDSATAGIEPLTTQSWGILGNHRAEWTSHLLALLAVNNCLGDFRSETSKE